MKTTTALKIDDKLVTRKELLDFVKTTVRKLDGFSSEIKWITDKRRLETLKIALDAYDKMCKLWNDTDVGTFDYGPMLEELITAWQTKDY